MKRTAVESTSVVSIGYDGEELVLEVEFVDGGVYQYFDVPAWQHEAVMGAASIGRYINGYIKPHHRYLPV